MRRKSRPLTRRAGAVLDVIIGFALVLLGAFALNAIGLSFADVFHGAARFFGL